MYKSVIEIIEGNLQTQIEREVLCAVRSVGINVDKDELIRALVYDRQQYEKGYADAKKEYQRPHGKWETDREDIEWGNHLKKKYCTNCGSRPHYDKEKGVFILTAYCHNCGAKMDSEETDPFYNKANQNRLNKAIEAYEKENK